MAIIDVVKNEGEHGSMAWKYPSEEIGSWSQLIVREGEEALLFSSGMAADRFVAGRYTLETANLPLLRSLVRLPFGGKTPFTAELWYVNVDKILDIKWGTDAPILLSHDDGQMPMLMRGYGLLGVRIADARLFLSSLRGRVDGFDQRSLTTYLRGQLSEPIRSSISGCLRQYGADFCERADASRLLAEQLQQYVAPILAQYGIAVACFVISDLCVATQEGGSEKHMTFSVLSMVMPSSSVCRPAKGAATSPKPIQLRNPIVVAAFILLLLLLLVFVVLLPPAQTADFLGIAFVAAAHCLVTAVAVWLFDRRRELLLTVGFAATATLYWVGAVGTALVMRLLNVTGIGLLATLELGMAGIAALALMGFWYGKAYDTVRHYEEAVDEED